MSNSKEETKQEMPQNEVESQETAAAPEKEAAAEEVKVEQEEAPAAKAEATEAAPAKEETATAEVAEAPAEEAEEAQFEKELLNRSALMPTGKSPITARRSGSCAHWVPAVRPHRRGTSTPPRRPARHRRTPFPVA